MSHDKIEKFARMANQIGDYFAAMPSEEGAEGVALHIRKFWAPKMIAETLAALGEEKIALNATSARGFAILRREIAAVG
jgi:formate dehydrogenase subunit delta